MEEIDALLLEYLKVQEDVDAKAGIQVTQWDTKKQMKEEADNEEKSDCEQDLIVDPQDLEIPELTHDQALAESEEDESSVNLLAPSHLNNLMKMDSSMVTMFQLMI